VKLALAAVLLLFAAAGLCTGSLRASAIAALAWALGTFAWFAGADATAFALALVLAALLGSRAFEEGRVGGFARPRPEL
jgi:hypothetical protein